MGRKKKTTGTFDDWFSNYSQQNGIDISGANSSGSSYSQNYQQAAPRKKATFDDWFSGYAEDHDIDLTKTQQRQETPSYAHPTYKKINMLPTNQQAPSYTQNPLVQAAQNKVSANNGGTTASALQRLGVGINTARNTGIIPVLEGKKEGLRDYAEAAKHVNESYGQETIDLYKNAEKQYNDIDAQIQELKRQNTELNRQAKMQSYQDLTRNPDFTQKSGYQSTANGREFQYSPTGYGLTETGFDDYMYDFINRNPQAVLARHLNASQGDVRIGTDDAELENMTDDQIRTFNYLYQTDRDRAYEYIEDIRPELRAIQAQKEKDEWSAFAQENPVLSSVVSVPNNLVSSIDSLIGMGVSKLDGNEIDPNAGYFRGRRAQNAIRGTVGEMAGETLADWNAQGLQAQEAHQAYLEGRDLDQAMSEIYTKEHLEELKQTNFADKLRKFGNTAYGSIMSQADNMMNVALTGGMSGAALTLMSMTAMPDTISSAKERGLSDEQAFGLGVISGAAEYVTEKVSLEALLDMDSIARKGLARYIGVNALTEGSEEVASDFINFVAEHLIAGDKSEFAQNIADYEASGMNHEDAVKQAWADQVEQTLYSFMGGALAGGGTAVGFGISNTVSKAQLSEYGRSIKEQLPATSPLRQMDDTKLAEFFINVQQTKEAEARSNTALTQAAEQLVSPAESAETEEIAEEATNESPEEENVSKQQTELRNQQIMAPLRIYSEAQMAEESERNYIDKIAQDRFGTTGYEVYRSALQNNGVQSINERMETLGDFTKAYNAGMNNQAMPTNLRISEQSVRAAYATGQNAVLDQYRDNNGKFKKGFTSYYGSDAGLAVDTDIVRKAVAEGLISQKDMDGFADLGVRLGTKIYLEETMPQNGWYENGGIAVALDADNGMRHVLSHELVHRLQEAAPEEYETLKSYIADYIGSEELERSLSEYYNLGKSHGISISQTVAMDEVVADWVAGHMVSGDLEWTGFVERASQTQEGRTFLQKVRDFFRNIVNKLKGSKNPDVIQLSDAMVKAQKLLDDTLNAAQRNVARGSESVVSEEFKRVLESRGAYAGENSVAKYSLRSWNETDINALKSALQEAGYSTKEINKWIKDVNGVAATVLADRTRLDYEADEYQSALKPNAEYYYTLDLSTLCKKRLLYQGTYNAIMHQLVNKALMPEDTIKLRRMMDDMGYEVPCGICYEESRKKNEGKFAERWLHGHEKWAGYENQKHSDPYIPKLDDVTTTDGRAWLQKNHPEAYDSYIEYQKGRGSANPKVSFTRTDYRGDILRMTKTDIANVKHIGGLRIQSFSDFETVHVIDMMQAVMDMASKNLTAQAYTKVPAFADIFGGTGIKINLSLIGKVENGKLVFDAKEGIDPKEAFRIRKKYSENVGTILVGANDESILAAWADPRVDMVIPFHRSGWSGEEFEKLGLKGYSDYTDQQSERYLMDGRDISLDDASKILGYSGKNKLQGIYSEDYWDYSKSGKENAEAYLKLCAEKHYRPVFYKFLTDNGDGTWSLPADGSADGYWKSLTDYKMYNNDGVGAKQQEVKPVFDMRAANKAMREYDGNPNTLPVAQDVVDKFVEEYKAEGKKFSLRSDSEGRELSKGQQEYFKDSKAVDENGNLMVMYHGTLADFTVFDPDAKPVNGRMLGDGFYFSPSKDAAQRWARGGKVLKVYLNITNPYVVSDNEPVPQAILDEFDKSELLKDDPNKYPGSRQIWELAKESSAKFFTFAKNVFRGETHQEILRRFGYDGIILHTEDNSDFYRVNGDHYVVFNSDQIKKTINKNPSHNPDIRYSLRYDSEGNKLSDGQNEYFKDSKARYEDGSLMVLYHTTNKGGFTVFDPKFSDDKRSLFFASNFDVSQTYGKNAGSSIDLENAGVRTWDAFEQYANKTFSDYPGWDTNKSWVENIQPEIRPSITTTKETPTFEKWIQGRQGQTDYYVTVKIPTPSGNFYEVFNTSPAGLLKDINSVLGLKNNQKGFYECYLNLKNPMIVDAKGARWNNIRVSDTSKTLEEAKEKIRNDASVNILWLELEPDYDTDLGDYAFSVTLDGVAEIKNKNGKWKRISFNKVFQTTDYIDDPEGEVQLFNMAEDELRKAGINDVIISHLYDRFENVMDGGIYAESGVLEGIYFDKNGERLYDDDYYSESGESRYTNTRGISAKAKNEGYDGVIIKNLVDLGGASDFQGKTNLSDIVIAFDSNQVKDVRNLNPTDNKDIRYSLRESGYNIDGKAARWTDERIDSLIYEYGASNPDYSQAYAALMNPRDYLKLTLSDDMLDRWNKGSNAPEHPEMYSLDKDRLRENTQTPFLIIYSKDGTEVQGHEGRHRMRALLEAGITSVPVVIRDTDTKYSKQTLESMTLTAQDFGEGPVNNGATVTLTNLVPIKETNRDELTRLFGGNADVQFSLRGSRDIVAASERDSRIRNEYMEAAASWRSNMTALSDVGKSGFSTNMTALIRDYNKNIDKNTSERIVGEIRSLTREMVRNQDMTYSEISQKANVIAAKILWGTSDSRKFPDGSLLFNEDAARAVDDIRNDIMAQILKSTTRGEGKYQALSKEFADYRKRANDKITEVRRKRDAKLEEIQAKKREEIARKVDSSERTTLLKRMNRLNKIMKTTSEANQEMIKDFIGEFNLVAKSMTAGKAENLADLSDYIDNMMRIDPDFMPTERTIKDVARLGKKNVADLTIEEVAQLNEALLNLENAIRTSKRLIDSEYKQHISELGNEIIEGVRNTKGIANSKIGVFNWFQQTYDKTLATPVIRPETEILRLVGFDRNNPLYKLTFGEEGSLASGQKEMVRYKWQANKRYTDRFVNDKQFADSIMGKKARACEITGKRADGTIVNLKVTPDMLMALYMHAQNKHNFRHFGEWNDESGHTQHGGGITIPDFDLYRKGKIQEAYRVGTRDGNLITMTRSALNAAFKQLTEKEMSFIRSAQAYYSEMSQPEINRVSNLLLGYSIANEENYFRINTDSNYRGTNMDAIKFDGTIEGMGWTKERIEGARNAILLIPLTEQFQRDIDAHAKYIGMAIPVRNFNKAYGVNRQSYDENGDFTGTETSVQSAITGKWGSGATDYIQKLMSDVQNPQTSSESWTKIFGKLRSFYAGSVLALNAGVAIKQAASYPTAAAEIGWMPLIKAFGNTRLQGKMDMDLINKYSPLMYLRTQGMGYQELADLKNLNKGWLNRALNSKALNWIQDMDVMTVKKLWKASEYYVRDNFKDLQIGSDEYYKKVGEIHSRVIERTQPNYTTLQRGEILRSDSDFIRMTLGMFKTQPFQNFSVLFEATGELQAACRAYKVSPNEVTEAMRTAAVKKMARALSSQIVASLVFALMQAAWDWTRGRDDKYKDKEGRITFASAFKQIGINMGSNAFGMIPLGSVIYETIETTVDTIAKSNGGEAIFNATAYGLDASTATGIVNDLVDAVQSLTNISTSVDLESKNTTEQHVRGVIDILSSAVQAAGYPADNFVKDGQAVAVNVFRLLGATGQMSKYEQEFYSKRIFTAVSKDKKGYLEILYKAYDNDTDAYNKLYSIYTENDGFATSSKTSKEYIDDKMNAHIKEQMKNQNRDKAGLTESQLNDYQEALDRFDANHNGSYTQEETYNALMSIALSQKQKETLWDENGWKKSFSEYKPKK